MKVVAWLLGVWVVVCGGAVGAPVGIALNEDDSHFFAFRTPEEMSLEGLNAFVDQYAGTQVTELFLCPNAQKASYKSAVWDAVWEIKGTQRAPEAGVPTTWLSNAKLLSERGLDPYAVWIARCREKGISPWLSMRMNDVHNVDDVDSYIHNSFWREHPEYWRVPGSKGSWVDRAFDYGIPAVREHHMALVKELLERYDPDGLELDWMRFGYHFKPGHEAEGAEILTQFMREVRGLARAWGEKRGHPIQIGARVPTVPAAAKGLGMDAIRWAQEGLIDRLVPTPFWATTDFDIPMEAWRAELGESAKKLVLYAGGEILLRASPGAPGVEATLESTRAFAAAHLARGADQIYLFNYMDRDPMHGAPGQYRALLTEGLSLDVVKTKPCRYVVTYRDTVAAGMSNGAVLPFAGKAGGELGFYLGPRRGVDGQLVVGLGDAGALGDAAFDVVVNGERLAASAAAWSGDLSAMPGSKQAVVFSVPAKLLKDGANTVRVQQVGGAEEHQVVWAELEL